jgi:drug/metabolite transporter (DMT)-like permease
LNALPSERLAVAALFVSGLLWGLTWIPLKHFAAQGLNGLGMTLVGYGVVGVAALPLIWRERRSWKPQSAQLLFAALAGGAANVCFVVALMFGDVVRVMLMFYLAPVWCS